MTQCENFETETSETTPEPVVERKERKESSDALARRTLCTTSELTKAFNQLIEMHTFMRPSFSKVEGRFIHKFIKPTGAVPDKYGNYFMSIGAAPIMWSAHTDTVHRKKGIQSVGFDKMEIGLAAEDKSGANCLGADDTVGVWLMLQMIAANVPGLYAFHRAEEGGRKGSQFVMDNHKDQLAAVKYCIALDRRGYKSVITYQSGERTCSEAFAKTLIEQLGDMNYETDDTGSFTDSYSYIDVISECTNISVGYTAAHTSSERLDLDHAFKLREKLIGFDWTKLVAERKPGTTERKTYSYTTYHGSGNYGTHSAHHGYYGGKWGFGDDDNWIQLPSGAYVRKDSAIAQKFLAAHEVRKLHDKVNGHRNGMKDTTNHHLPVVKDLITAKAREKAAVEGKDDDEDDDQMNDMALMTKLCARNPQAIAEILDQMDFTYEDLRDEIMEMYGVVNC